MSNNTEFKWDDETVLEFVQFTLKNSPLLQGRYTDLEQFKESKQPKPEWEILSYLSSTHPDRYVIDQTHLNWNHAVVTNMDIHSVKRLSDGEVFTIGDKVMHKNNEVLSDNIKRIILSNENRNDLAPFFIMEHISFRCYIDKISHHKEPLFVTEDGVSIHKDYSGRISTVYEDFSFNYDCTMEYILSERETPHTFTIKYFSSKEAAEEYIIDNKPLCSLKEIRSIGRVGENNLYYKKLVALAESKLK